MIPRRLRRERTNGAKGKIISQHDLHSFSDPLVILGEAGVGKTRLMRWLEKTAGYTYCTARRLCSAPHPDELLNTTNTLLIDALDELATQRDGDSVDAVLGKLESAGHPRFILACRVADWRSASSQSLVTEHYGVSPIELHLLPFTESEAHDFLASRFGSTEAERIQQHLTTRGLSSLLGNPQTLLMVADVARENLALPESKMELFKQAISLLAREHRDEKIERQPAPAEALDAAGAACAALLLTGCEAITRRAAAQNEIDLPLAELYTLTQRSTLNAVLDTRLFIASDADRFTYLHRSIAEYLAARWLASKCTRSRQRRRILHIFQGHGGVPSALRGLHAWLAIEPSLTKQVVQADPMGLIEYGDADNLSLSLARELLGTLRQLAQHNPAFLPWGGDFRVRTLLHPDLQDEINALIAAKGTPTHLRILLLQALRDDTPESPFIPELKRIVLDTSEYFSIRRAASEALVAVVPNEDWLEVLDTLREIGDKYSLRLAIEWISERGHERVADEQIVELVRAYAAQGHRTLGVLFILQQELPLERIDGILNLLSRDLEPFELWQDEKKEPSSALIDFAYHLISRRLEARSVEALQLWHWLRPYEGSNGYQDDNRDLVNDYLRKHDEIRRAIQKSVFLDERSNKKPHVVKWELNQCAAGLQVNESDAIVLFGALDPRQTSSDRWKAFVKLVYHDETSGLAVREAARSFVDSREEDLAWIDSLVNPPKPQWKIDEEKRREQRRVERLQQLEKRKALYAPYINELKTGKTRFLIYPAQAYLGQLFDFQDESPVDRVTAMLGSELGTAALEGFEAFLHQPEMLLTAEDISSAIINKKIPPDCMILAAGLSERVRRKIALDDLDTDRILKGFVIIYQTGVTALTKIDGVEEIVSDHALKRGIWKKGIRLRLQRQFSNLKSPVHELYNVMRSENFRQQATKLASDWLQQFPKLPLMAEIEIADRLIASGEFDTLGKSWKDRYRNSKNKRRRLWSAIGLLVDFEAAVTELSPTTIERELLWDLRARIQSRHRGTTALTLTAAQMNWIVFTFRKLWPSATRPIGITSGNTKDWDATEFIRDVITRLGNDLSEDARRSLAKLRDAPEDGYTWYIKDAMAEQQQTLVESSYRPMTLHALHTIVTDQAPIDIKDLQAFMLEELTVVQAKIDGDDIDSWRGFFSDEGKPYGEERCRDHLLGLLRQGCQDVTMNPETHVAADKRVDITCELPGSKRLPIEIKGQWNRDLWTAADQQLDRLYTSDWRAEAHGIYLILWFGHEVGKKLKGLRGLTKPSTPDELRELLVSRSSAAQQGRVAVVVLDLERSSH